MKTSHLILIIAAVLCLAIILSLTVYYTIDHMSWYFGRFDDKIGHSLSEEYSSVVYGDKKSNANIEFGEYAYKELDTSDYAGNPYLKKVESDDVDVLCDAVELFESVMRDLSDVSGDVKNINDKYAFDKSVIDESDYYYANYTYDNMGATGLENCTEIKIYCFDTEKQILYYFYVDRVGTKNVYGI